jgi:hypothetical protein
MNSTSEDDIQEINEIFQLLDTYIVSNQTLQPKTTLFIGKTGTGKSTLAHFIVGNQNLEAKRVEKSSEDCNIFDGDVKISVSTTQSKTLYPEFINDPASGSVLADCPGFHDTRSYKHDIAATIFTKQLANNVKNLKLIAVISHHAVRKGESRTEFTELLGHLAEFLTNVEKYRDSIALVVTKVRSRSSEDDIIEDIAGFIAEVKSDLKGQTQDSLSNKRNDLMDIFLKQHNNKFSNIQIFRRPTKEGPLHQMENMEEQKIKLYNLIFNQIIYTESDQNDYGLTISAGSKFKISKMEKTVRQNTDKAIDDICNSLLQTFEKNIETSSTIEDLKKRFQEMSGMVNTVESGNNVGFKLDLLMEWLSKSDIKVPEIFQKSILRQQHYMKFLKNILPDDDSTANRSDFVKYYPRLLSFKSSLLDKKMVIANKMEKFMDQHINQIIKTLSIHIIAHYDHLTEAATNYVSLEQTLRVDYDAVNDFLSKISSANQSFEIFMERLSVMLDKISVLIPTTQQQKITEHQNNIIYLKQTMNINISGGNSMIWAEHLQSVRQHLQNLSNWFSTLNILFEKLLTYQLQENVDSSVIKNLKNWNNLKSFMQDNHITVPNKSSLNAAEQKNVNTVIEALISTEVICNNSNELVVTGNYVKMSDITKNEHKLCPNYSVLKILAHDTIYFDTDLLKRGKKLTVYIIAPIWNVIGTRLINLDGLDGQSEDSVVASSNTDGKAGQSGGAAGNFFGVGAKFINEELLTVSANGGNGGNGQNGANGYNGVDGETPKLPDPGTMWHHIWSNDYCELYIERVNINGYKHYKDDPDGNKVFKSFGKPGSPGTNASNGGKNGFGGPKGQIEIKSIALSHNIKTINEIGRNGEFGRGGYGGKGGRHGETIHYQCQYVTRWHNLIQQKQFRYHLKFNEPSGQAAGGQNGRDNIAGSVEQDPQVSFEPFLTVINTYKKKIQSQINALSQPIVKNFLESISSKKTRTIAENDLMTQPLTKSPVDEPASINGWMKWISEVNNNFKSQFTSCFQMQLSENQYCTNDANRVNGCNGVVNINYLLILLDLCARKITNVKPSFNMQTNFQGMEAQAVVLNIVDAAEERWYNFNHDNNPNGENFDFVRLQQYLMTRVLQLDDIEDVEKIKNEAFKIVDEYNDGKY